MGLKYQKITGTRDIFAPEIFIWQHAEKVARKIFDIYSYQEIRTPIIESTELFVRSVGNTTDIVEKEMYTFVDRDESSVTLRPEETAGVIRSYLENGLYNNQSLCKFYYVGPMFRRERPQQGRYRQFHQIGAELIGSSVPSADFEIISFITDYFEALNLKGVELNLNSAGCQKCRPGYIMSLKQELDSKVKGMCQDCQRRYSRNIFRLLDCKQDGCKKIIDTLPVVKDFLCEECSNHFNKLKAYLEKENINYQIDPHLVRGIDYYTKTIFEFIHKGLGSQNAIAAGGRYDLLVQDMGGLPTGAVGFSIGEERLIMVLQQLEDKKIETKSIDAYLISLDSESYEKNIFLLRALRKENINSDIDYELKSLKAQMRTANKMEAKYVIIRGSDEIKNGIVTLKDMKNGGESKVQENEIIKDIKKRLQ